MPINDIKYVFSVQVGFILKQVKLGFVYFENSLLLAILCSSFSNKNSMYTGWKRL